MLTSLSHLTSRGLYSSHLPAKGNGLEDEVLSNSNDKSPRLLIIHEAIYNYTLMLVLATSSKSESSINSSSVTYYNCSTNSSYVIDAALVSSLHTESSLNFLRTMMEIISLIYPFLAWNDALKA